jgi:xanthine dehydrogenase small subunit
MVDDHGSQCGYCTPGVVMALAGWAEAGCDRSKSRIALTGNLCRCTGYLPIFAAAEAVAATPPPSVAQRYGPAEGGGDGLLIDTGRRRYFAPTTLDEAVAFKAAHPQAAVIAGATELGVWRNKRGDEPAALLSLARIPGLDRIDRDGDKLVIGATATWSQIEPVLIDAIPSYRRIVERFGSPQIRNAATLAGNVANGSPIADSLGLLCVMDAELDIVGPRGSRRRPVCGFYTGYKQKDLAADELIERIHLPLPVPGDRLRFTKVSRRVDLDIATFGAAIRIREVGGVIEQAAVALTGVAATVVRLPQTEQFLTGRPFDEETFREAGRIARGEIKPITDVRGSRDFRLLLAENILAKFYFDCASEVASACR